MKYIIDPITGEKIENTIGTGEDKKKGNVIDPFSGQSFSIPDMSSNIDMDDEGQITGVNLSEREAQSLASNNPFTTIQEDFDIRAEKQPAVNQFMNGLAKAGVTFTGALLDNTIGAYVGLGSMLTGGSFHNNAFGQMIDQMNESAQEYLPNYYTRDEQNSIDMFSTNFWADKVLNGAAYSGASIASMLIPGLGLSKVPGAIGKVATKRAADLIGKGAKSVETAKTLRNIDNALDYGSKTFKSAIAESGVEARETYKELKESLTEMALEKRRQEAFQSGKFELDDNGQVKAELTEEDFEKIEKYASAGSNANFATNLGLVAGTNFLIFGKMMRGGTSEGFKELRKNITKQGNKFAQREKSKLRTAIGLGEDAATESFQEGGQFASNIAFKDFYSKQFDDEQTADIIESVTKGIKETVGSKDGLESMLIGAIVGGGMTGLKAATNKLKGDNAEETTRINEMLEVLNSPTFQKQVSKVRDDARTASYMKDMSEAVVENDEAAFHKASFNMFKSDLYSHLNQGTEEVALDKLKELKNLNPEEFKKYFEYGELEQKLDPNAIIDNHIKNAEKVIDVYKNLEFFYGENGNTWIEKLLPKVPQSEQQIKAIYKAQLFDVLTNFDYINNREKALIDEISKLSNNEVSYDAKNPTETVKQLTESNVNPIDKKKISIKLKELKTLAKDRETSNELYNRLENIDKDENVKLLEKQLKTQEAKVNKKVKETVNKKAEEAVTNEDKEQVKTEAAISGNEDTVNDILKRKEDKVRKEAKKINTDNLSKDLHERYSSNPELMEDELNEINEIIGESTAIQKADKNDLGSFYTNLNKLERQEDPLYDKIKSYFDKVNKLYKTKEDRPQPDAPHPVDVSDKAIKSHEESSSAVNESVDFLHTKLITNTLDKRKDGFPDIYDVVTLNNPKFGEVGTKVYARLNLKTDFNSKLNLEELKQRGEIRLFIKQDGKDVVIGQLQNTINEIEVDIRQAIASELNTNGRKSIPELDLNLEIADKWGGKINNNNTGEFYSPFEVVDKPIFGVVVGDKNKKELVVPNHELNIRLNKDKLKLGHTYFMVPTAKKDVDGNIIYYPALMTTRKLKDLNDSEKLTKEITDLLINSNKIDKKIPNRPLVNKIIHLNYDVNGDNIFVYPPTGPRITLSKTNREGIEAFLQDMVMRVDINEINKLKYNKKISDEGRVQTNVDKSVPVYDTAFVIKKGFSEAPAFDSSTAASVEDINSLLGNTLEATESQDDMSNEPPASSGNLLDSDVSLDSGFDNYNIPSSEFNINFGTWYDEFVRLNPDTGLSYEERLDIFVKYTTAKPRLISAYEKTDTESELQWLERVLPNTPVKVLKDLSSVASQGKNAWGLFMNGAIYLRENFSKGTVYHEAFHAVYNGGLSAKEQVDIYAEAQSRYGTFSLSEEDDLKKQYPTLDRSQLEDIWLEEKLAEDFRRYVLYQSKDTTLSQKLKNFFLKLWNLITGATQKPSVTDKVFSKIHKGKYGKKVINRRFNNIALASRIDNMTQEEEDQAVDIIDTVFEDIIDEQLKKAGVANTNDARFRLLKRIDINGRLYPTIYHKIKEFYDKQPEGDVKEYARKVLLSFRTTDNKLNDLVKLHMQFYKANKFINLTSYAEIESADEVEVNDENNFVENYQISNVEKSGKDQISKELKRALFNLRSTEKNLLGLRKRVDFDSLYNYLERNLSGIFDVQEQLDQLDHISNFFPELKDFRRKLDNDSSLSAMFFHHFAKGQNAYYNVVAKKDTVVEDGITIEKGTSMQIINNSRKSVNSEVLSNWETALTSSSAYVNGLPNTKYNIESLSMYDAAIDSLKGKTSIELKDLNSVAKVLSDRYKFTISAEDLYSNYKSITNAQFRNFLTSDKGVRGLLEYLAEGKDPFVTQLPFNVKDSLATITNLLTNTKLDYLQSSILNADGKIQYSYIIPNAIHTTLNFLNSNPEAVENFYGSDPSYENSLLLQQVQDNKKFRVIVGDGFRAEDQKNGTRFNGYNSTELSIVNINMYLNQGRKDAFYSFPMLSDSPINYFLENKKFTEDEALDHLYDIFLFEKNRIDASGVSNYSSNEFVMMPFLNQYSQNDLNKVQFVTDKIKEYYDEQFLKYLDRLADNETITATEDGYISENLDYEALENDRYPTLVSALKEYFLASTLMRHEITTVFSGDPAFAKNSTDLNKRIKQLNSPTQLLDTRKTGLYFNMATMYDVEVNLKNTDLFQAIKDYVEDNPSADNTARLNSFKKAVNQTDGQTLITIDRWRKIMEGSGQWTPELDSMWEDVKNGTEDPNQTLVMMNAIKGFYFGLSKMDNGKILPTQKKDSEMPLLPSFTKNNPVLQDISDRMNAIGKYEGLDKLDGITFESTIKMGKRSVTSPSNLEDLVSIEYNYKNFGIQQPSPKKHLDSKVNFGTQFRKLIISNLTGTYTMNGTEYTGSEIADLFQTIVGMNLKEDYNKLLDDLGVNDNDINKLHDILVQELDNGDYGYEYAEALEVLGDEFKLPLWNPFHSHRIESMLNSLVKSRVTKQKIKGATYINASDYGVSYKKDGLKTQIGYDSEGKPYIKYMEAVLPAWSKDIMYRFMNPDGTIDPDMPQELREIVGYRIPTEDKYSMMNVRVVGFSPQAQGGHIYLPAEITEISGLDFDIDKLFFMIPEHEVSYDISAIKEDLKKIGVEATNNKIEDTINNVGKVDRRLQEQIKDLISTDDYVEDIRYIKGDTGSKKARNNSLIEISKTILSSPQTFGEQTNPGNFENWKRLRDFIQELRPDTVDVVDFGLPQTQEIFFLNNNEAGSLIGIFANHNSSHAQNQHVVLDIEDKYKFSINGFRAEKLDDIYTDETRNEKKNSISRSLATLVSAAVDAVKDPVFFDLNLNRFTANMAATMLRLGVDEKTTMLFINQPMIRELVKRVTKEEYISPAKINSIVNDLEKAQGDFKAKDAKELSSDDLIKNIKSPNAKLNYSTLAVFKKLYPIAEDLNTIVLGTKMDATPPGPLMANNEVRSRRVTNIKEGLPTIKDSNRLFGSEYKNIDNFYTYTYDLPTKEILSKHLPWYNEGFLGAKNAIRDHLVSDFSDKTINDINQSLISYIYSNDELFNMTKDQYREIKFKFPAELGNFISKNQGKYLLLDMLNIDGNDITFRNNTKVSSSKITKLRNSWEEFDADHPELSEKLMQYNFIRNGFIFNARSFSHLMPISFHTDVFDNEEIKSIIDASDYSDKAFEPFVEQYIRNNSRSLNLPKVEADRITPTQTEEGKLVSFMANAAVQKDGLFPLYVKHQETNVLYKRVGDVTNGGYMILPLLGGKNEIEYHYQSLSPQSNNDANGVKIGKIRFLSGDVNSLNSRLEETLNVNKDTVILENQDNSVNNEIKGRNDENNSVPLQGNNIEDGRKENQNKQKKELQGIFSGKLQPKNGEFIQTILNKLRTGEISGSRIGEPSGLEHYVDDNNLWFTDINPERFLAEGGEQIVLLDEDGKNVIKLNSGVYYNTWEEYLNNLLIHNYLFPETAYELVGFINADDTFRAVVKQPFVQSDADYNKEAVLDMMKNSGFSYNQLVYTNENLNIRVEDLHRKNVLFKGNIPYVIDSVNYKTIEDSFFNDISDEEVDNDPCNK